MIGDRHLVPLKPDQFADFACPDCDAHRVEANGSVWPGIHVLGDYRCTVCGFEFLRDLPVGFAVDHPMAIGKKNGELFNPTEGEIWIHEPLLESYRSKSDAPIAIEHIVNEECDRVVILNTLDYLYGHVLLKLFNAQHYMEKHPDLGLVLILPRMYAWLIPEGVAEVWLVDLPLGKAHGWHIAIDAFVQQQLPRFTEVYLGKGYAHPEFVPIDITRFSRVRPFQIEDFAKAAPHITFVARTDRLWFANAVNKFLYRALNRIGAKQSFGVWYVHRQTALILRTMRLIQRSLPEVRFSVVGLGEPGGFGNLATDMRTNRMDASIEKRWCEAYAKSWIVIGVHGSNMLLPTAHAAGLIEILPHDRFGNIVQDVCVRHADRLQLFLYRFVDEFVSPRTIARNAVSMFRDFPLYLRDNRENIF